MRLFYIYSTLTLLSYASISKAQFSETIRTGRPGQAIGPFTVGKGVFQNQSGFDVSNVEHNDGLFTSDSYDINSVFRYGLIENFEFSGVITYGFDESERNDLTKRSNQMKQVDLGMRTNFVEGKGLCPSIGFQYRMKIPPGSGNEYPKYIGSVITLVTGQRLSNTFGLNTNWGVVWNGNTAEPTAFYVISLSAGINDRWGMVAEYYGTFSDTYLYGNTDAGLSYLFNPDLQFDLYGGFGGFGSQNDTYFTSVGVSWRIHNRHK